MPIVVTCPGCPTKLSAPDNAAGKQIRCPKCGAVAPVPDLIPAEEVPVVEATVAPPKPKPKPVQAEADDEDEPPRKKAKRNDDDDNEADPPRKKKKRRYDDDDDYDHDHRRRRKGGGGGGNGGKIAAIIVVGVLVLAGIGVGIYFLTGKGGPLAKKAPLPPGWKEYPYPNEGFKAAFPKEPQVLSMNAGGMPMGGMGGMGAGRGGFPGTTEVLEMESVSSYTSGLMNPDDQIVISLTVARVKKEVPRSMRDQVGQMGNTQINGMEIRKLRWLGYDAAEMIMAGSVTRIVYTNRHMIIVQISGRNGA